ncbi:MAG: hypothetical protein ACLQQ4_04740 [Bacteroidia bacterium]
MDNDTKIACWEILRQVVNQLDFDKNQTEQQIRICILRSIEEFLSLDGTLEMLPRSFEHLSKETRDVLQIHKITPEDLVEFALNEFRKVPYDQLQNYIWVREK